MALCRATKASGDPCRAPATGPHGYCWAHARPGQRRAALQDGLQGGQEQTQPGAALHPSQEGSTQKSASRILHSPGPMR
jgi:hypothetical protein